MRTTLSHTVTLAHRAARLTLALTLAVCASNVARGEYIAKTFYATFDDGTVVTGTFSGNPGEDGILKTDYHVDDIGFEVVHFIMDVFIPNPPYGDAITLGYDYTLLSDDGEFEGDLLAGFIYDPTDNSCYVHAPRNFGSVDGNFELRSGYFIDGMSYGYTGPPRVSNHTEGLSVTFTDIGNGISFDWIEAHIAVGIAAGLIDNSGISNSLLSMLEAVGSAVGNDKPDVAIRILNAFIHRIGAQAGHNIDSVMAQVLIDDANDLINVLQD